MLPAQHSSRTADDETDATAASGVMGKNIRKRFGRGGWIARGVEVEGREEGVGEEGVSRPHFGGEYHACGNRHFLPSFYQYEDVKLLLHTKKGNFPRIISIHQVAQYY